jgi:ornithine cyclodeaminase/alanine dehydrogenase-like protein (mu-crystallin family)
MPTLSPLILAQVLTEQRSGRESESEIIVVDLTGCGAQGIVVAFAFECAWKYFFTMKER